MDKASSFLVVGHGDVTEASLCDFLTRQGYASVISSTDEKLNVLDRTAVEQLFDARKPEYVILTSVRSGGIGANQAYPAEMIFSNLQAQNHVIDVSLRRGVKKFLFLGASCMYPKECPQPMKEEYFLAGPMEKTSEPYSLAKAAGVVMCQAYRKQYGFPAIVAVPATVYGPGGYEDPKDAHVLTSMMMRFREAVTAGASQVEFWGSGAPWREFIWGDDLARACLFLLEHYDAPDLINIGVGEDIGIRELALLIQKACGFQGQVLWDTSKPDGAMRKLLDSRKLLGLGWKPEMSLTQGIQACFKAG